MWFSESGCGHLKFFGVLMHTFLCPAIPKNLANPLIHFHTPPHLLSTFKVYIPIVTIMQGEKKGGGREKVTNKKTNKLNYNKERRRKTRGGGGGMRSKASLVHCLQTPNIFCEIDTIIFILTVASYLLWFHQFHFVLQCAS